MMRSFVVALVTTAAAAVLMSSEDLAALTQPTPPGGSFMYPVEVAGGTPGVNIEVFLNGGKVQDAAIGSDGGASWVLDLGNVGKTRVTLYVDVCQDGKIVKVAFVSGGGQAPPEDENCNRRIAGVGWTSDCGVTRITINIRTWGARVLGCTPFYQRPLFIGAAGALAVVPFLAGGDGGPAVFSGVPQQPSVFVPPGGSATNSTTQPPPAQPPAMTDYTVSFGGITTFHPAGANTSFFCGILIINPVVNGATYIITAIGPAVLPNQNVTGTFNSNGQAAWRVGIGNFGSYSVQASVTGNNVTRTASANHNVTSAGGSCPSVP